jgi:hypothetical protein
MPLDSVEDTFSPKMVINSNVALTGDAPQYPQNVIIRCKNKNVRISTPLSGKLKLGSTAEWEEMFGGGMSSVVGGVLGTANNIVQWKSGKTLQQPWMNRKMYKCTKPFTFTLPLSFVTPAELMTSSEFNSSADWVVKPCLALLSLLYPRKVKDKNGDDLSVRSILPKNKKNSEGVNYFSSGDGGSIIGTFADLFKLYAVPGPSLMSMTNNSKDGSDAGDNVEVSVGNMLCLDSCYVTKVDVEFSESYDLSGCPIAATANVEIVCADAVYCEADGNFIVNKPSNRANELGNFIDACGKTVEHASAGMKNIKDSRIGVFNGSTNDKTGLK